jgi:hypothetical protein
MDGAALRWAIAEMIEQYRFVEHNAAKGEQRHVKHSLSDGGPDR